MSRLQDSSWSGTLAKSIIQTILNGLTDLGEAFKQSLQVIQDEVSPVRMDPPGNYLLFGQDTGIHQADAPRLFDTSSRWWNSRMIDVILQVIEERTRRRDISHIAHGDQMIQKAARPPSSPGCGIRQIGWANRVPQRCKWQPLAFAGSRQYLAFRNISGGHICRQSHPLYNNRYDRSTQTDTCIMTIH